MIIRALILRSHISDVERICLSEEKVLDSESHWRRKTFRG